MESTRWLSELYNLFFSDTIPLKGNASHSASLVFSAFCIQLVFILVVGSRLVGIIFILTTWALPQMEFVISCNLSCQITFQLFTFPCSCCSHGNYCEKLFHRFVWLKHFSLGTGICFMCGQSDRLNCYVGDGRRLN